MSKDTGELIIRKSMNLSCQPIVSYISSFVFVCLFVCLFACFFVFFTECPVFTERVTYVQKLRRL